MGAGHRPRHQGQTSSQMYHSEAYFDDEFDRRTDRAVGKKGQVIDNNGLREMLRAPIFAQLDPLRPSPDVSCAIRARSEDLSLSRSLPLLGMCNSLYMPSTGG